MATEEEKLAQLNLEQSYQARHQQVQAILESVLTGYRGYIDRVKSQPDELTKILSLPGPLMLDSMLASEGISKEEYLTKAAVGVQSLAKYSHALRILNDILNATEPDRRYEQALQRIALPYIPDAEDKAVTDSIYAGYLIISNTAMAKGGEEGAEIALKALSKSEAPLTLRMSYQEAEKYGAVLSIGEHTGLPQGELPTLVPGVNVIYLFTDKTDYPSAKILGIRVTTL